jgi:hypothetical protein
MPAAYEYLRAEGPLSALKLPHADEVQFRVTRHRDRYGHVWGDKRSVDAEIALSDVNIGSTAKLVERMAHEMIHLYQHRARRETANTQHNAEFKRRARAVCAYHLFDFKDFV